MDTQKWSLLLKVLDSGSISAAAAQSNYTISGISRMIANLEQEVGFPLLVRNNRGVGPTDECELMLLIISENLAAEYEKVKSKTKPKTFAKANIRYGRKKLRSIL